jgi:hypothetical protein
LVHSFGGSCGENLCRASQKKREEADKVYKRLIQILEVGPDELPDYLEIPIVEIEKYWNIWVFWRATGRRADLNSALMDFPKMAWDVIFLLDGLFSKLESQQAKMKDKERKNEN